MIRRLIDMQAAGELAGPSAVQAYGTSEGVRKAWESRSHGQLSVHQVERDRQYGGHTFELRDKGGKKRYTVHSLRYPGSRGYHVFSSNGRRISPDLGFDSMKEARGAVAKR